MIRQFIKNTPNSVFFWNGLALVLFIILCSVGGDIALSVLVYINIPAFYLIIMNMEDSRYNDDKRVVGYHYWVYLAPITWILIAVALTIVLICQLVFKIGDKIKCFNNWLNKK